MPEICQECGKVSSISRLLELDDKDATDNNNNNNAPTNINSANDNGNNNKKKKTAVVKGEKLNQVHFTAHVFHVVGQAKTHTTTCPFLTLKKYKNSSESHARCVIQDKT